MAANPATERYSGEGIGTSSRDSKTYQTTAQRVFDVTVTDPQNDDSATVQLAEGIPITKLSMHPSRPWLLCVDVQVRRVSPILFEVTANYDSPIGSTSENDDPLLQPPIIEWATVSEECEIDEDVYGVPICTIIGEPFDPPLKVTKKDLLLRITRILHPSTPTSLSPTRTMAEPSIQTWYLASHLEPSG